MEPAMGAVDLIVLQQQKALGAGPLAAILASSQLTAVFGSAQRALEQNQVHLGGEHGGKGTAFQLQGVSALGTGLRCIEDPRIAGRAAPHE